MYKEEFTARNYMIVGFDNGEGNINNRMWVRASRLRPPLRMW